ncbi:MAG: S-layer homology domain-containing protein, partial [Clostridia bacterium]|nr:S-layer homology domain-containing protein [Clostridia bacterium]
ISGDRYYVYVTDSISAMDSININGSGGDSKVSVALGGYNDAQYGGIYTDTITINNADVTTRALHSSKETTITNSTVNIESIGIMPAVVIGSGSRFENSNITVSKVQDKNVGIVGLHDLTISGGKTTVTAANGAAMLKAIMVYGEDNDSGLVLNKAEITTPSGGKIEQEQFRFGEDESSPVYRAWFIGDNSSSVIISPVSSRRSSGGGGTTQYTVTFETNGGNKINSVKVNKNSTLSKPTEPTKEGYTFDGWYRDKACKNAYDFGESVTKSITLYAKWVEKTKEPEKETEPTEPVTPKWENPFGDVKKSDWFYNAVADVASKGIVAGISDTAYEPNGTLTRAMFVTMLHRYAGEPIVNYAMNYTDIEDSWYTEAVRWASSTGVVKGFDNNSFRPDDSITREQAAAMLQRYAEFAKESNPLWNETNILSYDDFDTISEWAIPAVQWAAGAGVMKGRTDSTINPSENITRAEIAQMLVNYMGAVEKYKSDATVKD